MHSLVHNQAPRLRPSRDSYRGQHDAPRGGVLLGKLGLRPVAHGPNSPVQTRLLFDPCTERPRADEPELKVIAAKRAEGFNQLLDPLALLELADVENARQRRS